MVINDFIFHSYSFLETESDTVSITDSLPDLPNASGLGTVLSYENGDTSLEHPLYTSKLSVKLAAIKQKLAFSVMFTAFLVVSHCTSYY